MTAKCSETQTDTFERQVCRELGEISGQLNTIDKRLERGDENFRELNVKFDRLACMQPVSACSDNVKPGGWGKPAAASAGITAIIFGLIELAKQYLTTKGHL